MELDAGIVGAYSQPPQPYLDLWADSVPPWLDELDLSPAPPHNRMGTRSLAIDDWFVVDSLRDSELGLRRRLFDERPDDVFACLASAEEAAVEVLDLMQGWTTDHGLLGVNAADDGERLHPLAAAGLLVQEDLCIMILRDGEWRLDGAMLCFPALWRLADKLGRGMTAIHEPIGHYDDLESRVDRLFDRIRAGQPIWRRNMSLKPTHSLFLPLSRARLTSHIVPVAPDGSPYWIRSERQTLIKLPRTGAILFTIRTQLAPASVLIRRPDIAAGIVTMYESWDAEMNAFKLADCDIADSFLPWLRSIAVG